MTLLDAILKHMKDNNLDTANGINICQLIIDKDIDVGGPDSPYTQLVDSYKVMKKKVKNQK